MTELPHATTLPALFSTTFNSCTLEWFAADLTPVPQWQAPEEDSSGWCILDGAGIGNHVRTLAAGLIEAGVEQHDRVALMLANRPEHWLADLAVLHAGGVPITFYPTLSPEQVRSQAEHARITTAIIEGPAQFEQWSLALTVPTLRRVIVLAPDERFRDADPSQQSYADTLRRGTDLLAQRPDLIDERTQQIDPDDPATIIFTSGSTGTPKAVPLTHRNVISVVSGIEQVCDIPVPYRSISYLPTAHIVDRISSIYLVALAGGRVAFSPSQAAFNHVLERFQPTILVGVPRIWEKLLDGIRNFAKASPDEVSRDLAGLGHVSLAITAGAPMPAHVSDGLDAFGLRVVDMWGLTETAGPICISSTAAARSGTVGLPLPGTSVRLADDGELLVRGSQVAGGYLQHDGSISPITDHESWLATGDIGTIDAHGYVRIIDRKKEIIITSGGKNISPTSIESRLTSSDLIAQAFAFGDGHPYVVALLTLDAAKARRWLQQHGVDTANLTDEMLVDQPLVQTEVERNIKQANAELARVEQVKKWRLLSEPWTLDQGTVTPSLKLRRPAIHARHRADLAALYGESILTDPAPSVSIDTESPPGLNLARLREYLHNHCPGLLADSISASVIEGGRSNLTYIVSDGARSVVLRRPPLGDILPTAHDVAREHRIIEALSGTTFPVPKPITLCSDPSVIGAPFLVMEFVTGTPYRTDAQLTDLGPERTQTIAHRLVDTLIDLHSLAPEEVGLASLGNPDQFVARQLRRWTAQADQMHTRDVSDLQSLADRLAASIPESSHAAIVHGDYRLDNVLVDDDRIAAVLDWEMSTLGDPLTDVAILIAYGHTASAGIELAVGAAPGYPSGIEIADQYARGSGIDITPLPWYVGFAFFKLAVIAEGIHSRYAAGHTVGTGFENAGASVAPLITLATETLKEYS